MLTRNFDKTCDKIKPNFKLRIVKPRKRHRAAARYLLHFLKQQHPNKLLLSIADNLIVIELEQSTLAMQQDIFGQTQNHSQTQGFTAEGDISQNGYPVVHPTAPIQRCSWTVHRRPCPTDLLLVAVWRLRRIQCKLSRAAVQTIDFLVYINHNLDELLLTSFNRSYHERVVSSPRTLTAIKPINSCWLSCHPNLWCRIWYSTFIFTHCQLECTHNLEHTTQMPARNPLAVGFWTWQRLLQSVNLSSTVT